MVIDNRLVKWVVVSLLVLLLIPIVAMLGMMMFGGGMMAQMSGGTMSGGMMSGGMMSGGMMALCFLWTLLVAAGLIFLIVLVTRGTGTGRREISSGNIHS